MTAKASTVAAQNAAWRTAERPGGYLPIEEYALIGDGVTAALVGLDGSIDWLCLPRFDSPSVFARILDRQKGGCFQIVPRERFRARRAYEPDSNVLVTTLETESGEVEVVDFMPPHGGGERLSDRLLVRLLRCRRGPVEMAARFDPRFDYARGEAEWSVEKGVGVRAAHEDASLTLYTETAMQAGENGAQGVCALRAGEEAAFVLAYRQPRSMVWRRELLPSAARLLEQTSSYWREWVGRIRYDGPYAGMVRRSALALKLMDYFPTGAIIAAPTTSLPEHIGGVRNWDYRYSWLRDTAFTLYALYLLGFREEGEAFFDWILEVCQCGPEKLQVLYGVSGERRIDEFELAHLEGYRGSRPVRVGNAAYEQRQLDIYGEVVDCAYLLYKQGGVISKELWTFLRSLVDHVCGVWREPDQGIWEVRGGPQHFVYSKGVCWVALDRGIKMAERLGLDADLGRWRRAREEIHAELMGRGYNAERRAFTQSYGSRQMDAAVLALVLRKVIAANDPRMVSTVERVVEELSENGFLHRYKTEKTDDGLPPGEGVFLLCSFWLVDCYSMMGRHEEARALFERLLGCANDVGLFAEELDPKTGHHLGNFPQAFTHIALINAAVQLEREQREGRA
jgi:GH15 family glucan-1,4-alpha-glucosidase